MRGLKISNLKFIIYNQFLYIKFLILEEDAISDKNKSLAGLWYNL